MTVNAIIGETITEEDFVNTDVFNNMDMNEDGIINVIDIVAIVNYIVGGGT